MWHVDYTIISDPKVKSGSLISKIKKTATEFCTRFPSLISRLAKAVMMQFTEKRKVSNFFITALNINTGCCSDKGYKVNIQDKFDSDQYDVVQATKLSTKHVGIIWKNVTCSEFVPED